MGGSTILLRYADRVTRHKLSHVDIRTPLSCFLTRVSRDMDILPSHTMCTPAAHRMFATWRGMGKSSHAPTTRPYSIGKLDQTDDGILPTYGYRCLKFSEGFRRLGLCGHLLSEHWKYPLPST